MSEQKCKIPSVGGQAVIEGVMMRGSENIATAVRTPNGNIVYEKMALSTNNKKWYKIPFIRGVILLWDSLFVGMKALNFSAVQAGVEEDGKELSKTAIALTMIISLLIGVAVFFFIPAFIGSFAKTTLAQNVIEGIVRIVIFVGYISLISFLKDIQRVFQYHGAEHKAIFAYENHKELVPSEVDKFTTIHPRCGTSFIVIVLVLSIFVFSIVDTSFIHTHVFVIKNLLKFCIRIVCLPIIAAIAYEMQRYSSRHLSNPIIGILAKPGMWVQKITTKKPTEDQLEVAIVALKVSLGQEVENATEIIKAETIK
ncbi:MAG: DUF1385 domain-containing protein [Fusobacteria bacterium]|nr:DUF1385 domain-containing protein [Fusobacteriota bacterium]